MVFRGYSNGAYFNSLFIGGVKMKYFKPRSLTWWAGLGLVIIGVTESVATKSISTTLIEGLAAIGFRGALK